MSSGSTAQRLRGALVTLIGSCALLAFTGSAEASTYGVHECTGIAGSGAAPDAQIEGAPSGYIANDACSIGGSNYLQIGSSAGVGAGQSKAWALTAPNGTKINRAQGSFVLQGSANNNGHQPFFFYRGVNQGSDQLSTWSGAGSSAGQFDTDQFAGAVSRVGVGVLCNSGSTCAQKSGIYSRIGNLGLSMADTVAPDAPNVSGPALNGWINGTKQLNYSVSDTGSGVNYGVTFAGGGVVGLNAYCSAQTDAQGIAVKMQPCPATGSGSGPIDTSNALYTQGNNTVLVCAYEYGDNPQAGCKDVTVKVDTIAPSAPNGMAVAGGEDWKRDNGFDLSWTNPAQPHAPIAGAEVRITGPGNYDQTTYYPGANLTSIDDVQVPAKGDYTASVYLKDEAGNEAAANASSVHLRFDNTVPMPKNPNIANGWISRGELAAGYLQGWEPTALNETPPSGIAGYRVVINTNSDTDPCSGAGDPRACAKPITEPGQNNLGRTLHTGALAEGANYVHVVPISGSGMRATDVRHTPLKADFTDPVTQLQGDGEGSWINHDASLTAVATDALSGMQDTSEFPNDDPPATFLQIDGQTVSADAAQVSQALSGEGSHEVKFWARDLAGNTGAPQAKTVKIDKTAPAVAFINSQDPGDPDKLVAPASDALSGVVDGKISYRQDGGDQWKALDTAVRDGDLVARVDSGDLKPGVTYEFRAQASDLAGNTATSTNKQNGDPMKVTGPFRTITSVADLRINGKAKARVKYGKRPKVTGELVGENGQGVANASVDLISSYYDGSKKATDTVTVTTDGQGAFSASLPKGPGREIVADYRGDRRFLGVRSAPAKAAVKSKVTLKVPKVVDSDKGIAFTGKVKAKGAKFGKKGKRLEIQVLVGKKWKTVGKSIRASKKGKFKLSYEFTATYTRSIDYAFRAVVTKERGFPYLPSKSKKRSVTVTP